MIGAADHRQDRRGEPDRLITGDPAVAQLRPADLEGADPGLELPLGRMPVAHETPAALFIDQPGMGGEERLDLGLDRLHQHPSRPLAQHRQQRIVRERGAWLRQRDDGTLLHGVSFLAT